jgi:hypothetical protein
MPTIAAQHALLSLWPLVHKGRDRTLSREESEELSRLCEVLLSSIPAMPGYRDEARSFCVSLHNSGVFETGNIKGADSLLDRIDRLRHLLN